MSVLLRYAVVLALLSPLATPAEKRVRIGAEVLLDNLDPLRGKRVGLICNQTSTLPDGTHLVDTLLRRGITVTALLSPEHGIRGILPAGKAIEDTIDEKSGLPVHSLYGARKKPDAGLMDNIDVVIFDLQDVGARFYTYYVTMSQAMEAAAENGKMFMVLDRPNPINGIDIEGPILDSALESGVGRFPLPIRHALTLGELATMITQEGWIRPPSKEFLSVVWMQRWKRTLWYDETGLAWIPPSPNMKRLSTATVYPGICLFEGTNVSEGRGTLKPFEYIGAPWIDGKMLARRLNALRLPGARFHAIVFTPRADSIRSPHPKFEGRRCGGVFLQVKDRRTLRPVQTAVRMIQVIRTLYPEQFSFSIPLFDRLAGSRGMREILDQSRDSASTARAIEARLEGYKQIRSKYIAY